MNNKLLSGLALILFLCWFGTILVAEPFDGTQLIVPAVLAIFMAPVFVSVILEKPNYFTSDATEIVKNLNRNNFTTPQPSLKSAQRLAEENTQLRRRQEQAGV